jgi:hypothetical protein
MDREVFIQYSGSGCWLIIDTTSPHEQLISRLLHNDLAVHKLFLPSCRPTKNKALASARPGRSQRIPTNSNCYICSKRLDQSSDAFILIKPQFYWYCIPSYHYTSWNYNIKRSSISVFVLLIIDEQFPQFTKELCSTCCLHTCWDTGLHLILQTPAIFIWRCKPVPVAAYLGIHVQPIRIRRFGSETWFATSNITILINHKGFRQGNYSPFHGIENSTSQFLCVSRLPHCDCGYA